MMLATEPMRVRLPARVEKSAVLVQAKCGLGSRAQRGEARRAYAGKERSHLGQKIRQHTELEKAGLAE
jgi:hypothetical protein